MSTSKCPLCQKPITLEFTPFCSAHCKNVDLLKWLNEDYIIPVLPHEEEETALPSEEKDGE